MDKYAPQYCPQCGTALESLEAENRLRLYCPACDQLIYRNPKPCAGTIVVEEDQLLLVKRARPPRKGTWSVPAGFLEYNERPIVAAARELEEETGLTAEKQDLELFNTRFVTTESRENVVVILYRINRTQVGGELRAGSDAAAAQFWRKSDFESSGEELDESHKDVFSAAIEAK